MSDTASGSVALPLQATPERMAQAIAQNPSAEVAGSYTPEAAAFSSGPLDQLTALIDAGGPVVVILLLLSTVALAVVLLKWWQFSHLKLESMGEVNEALACWRRRDTAAAIARLEGRQQPTARLVHLALINLRRPETGHAELREELTRVAGAQLASLRSHLRTLEVIATLSPLLGLLGTVLGMIQAFQQLEISANQIDPGILSGGIWQALLTTALGLAIAIPVVLTHSWLERKVERCRHNMEDAVTQVFTRDLQRETATDNPAIGTTAVEHAI